MKNIIISILTIIICCFIPNLVYAVEEQIEPTKLTVSYEYKEDSNTVIATITSNNELQNTKPPTSWKLSEDKKQYRFEFGDNTTYTSSVVDIYGNVIPVKINVTQIDETPAKVNVAYQYKENTNTVIAIISSNRELQNTKPPTSWKLSEDKKQYTFEFGDNTAYTSSVVDKFGNIIPIQINVTQIDETPAKVTVSYEYKEETNTVVAVITSDKELQNTKPPTSWKLSEDKKIYRFEFGDNTTYMSSVVDRFGNIIPVQINVTQIDRKGPEVSVKYQFNQEKTQCTVTVTSNEELIQKTTPGWILSDDKKSYTYIVTEDTNYYTNFTDKHRNSTSVNIRVFFDITGIDVSKHNGQIDWKKVKNSGIDFAIIRVGFGQDLVDQDDPMFKYNVEECERLGIPYGVYLYSYALNEEHAKSEADHVLRLIKGYNPTYGIWIDIEDADGYKENNGMPSNETLVNIAETFCEKIKANGYQNVGIYASLDWFNNQLNSSKLDKYDKWVAQWGDKCTYAKEYIMWQYTDSGRVDGITGNVDMNKYYRNK